MVSLNKEKGIKDILKELDEILPPELLCEKGCGADISMKEKPVRKLRARVAKRR